MKLPHNDSPFETDWSDEYLSERARVASERARQLASERQFLAQEFDKYLAQRDAWTPGSAHDLGWLRRTLSFLSAQIDAKSSEIAVARRHRDALIGEAARRKYAWYGPADTWWEHRK